MEESNSSFSSRHSSDSVPPQQLLGMKNTRYDERVFFTPSRVSHLPSFEEQGCNNFRQRSIVNPFDIRYGDMQMMKFEGGRSVAAVTPEATTSSKSVSSFNLSHHQTPTSLISSTSSHFIGVTDPIPHSSSSRKNLLVADSSSMWYDQHSQCLLDYAMDQVSSDQQEQQESSSCNASFPVLPADCFSSPSAGWPQPVTTATSMTGSSRQISTGEKEEDDDAISNCDVNDAIISTFGKFDDTPSCTTSMMMTSSQTTLLNTQTLVERQARAA